MNRIVKLFPPLLACCLALHGSLFCSGQPRIGLALSGGGAKGIAHIGVLKVLDEAGVKVDYIAGTSMGSIVGALYSIGYSPQAMEELVTRLDWQAILSDETTRRNLSMEEKLEDGRYMLSLPIRNRRISLPTGLVSGQRVSMMLTDLTLSVHHVDDFSVLPIPFCCLATDLVTGEPVVLKSGLLADALRASMSIPTIFRPVELDGRLLVDGFLVRNLPVSDVREMGAEFVIGVDVGAPLYKKEDLTSLFEVMDQVINFRGAEDTKRQHELSDILIQPDLDRFSPMDFGRADSLIAAGEQAARAILPQLMAIASGAGPNLPGEDESGYRMSPIKQFYVTELRAEGLHDVSKELLLGKLQLDIPSRMTVKQVEEAVERAWGSRFFERVSYKIEPGDSGTALVIRVVEQEDDYLRLGVHYDNDLKSAVLVNLMYRNLGIEGSKLSLSANLSENESYSVNYLVFTNWRPGIALGIGNDYSNLGILLYDQQGQVQANLDYTIVTTELSLSTIFSNVFVMGLAAQHRETRMKAIFAPPDWDVGDYELATFIGFASLDTWDRTVYPKSGFHLNLNARLVADLFNNNFEGTDLEGDNIPDEFGIYSLQFDGAIPLNDKISLLLSTYAGATTDNLIPDDYKFYLGGQYYTVDQGFPFMGLRFLERPGTHAYMLQTGAQYELSPGQIIQLRANVGKAADSSSDLFKHRGTDFGAGITFGWHSPIGPLEYSLSYGNRRRETISNVNVGYRF